MKRIYYLILLLLFAHCGTLKKNELTDSALKQKISSDSTVSVVKNKAIELVKTGFTAGDGYSEVWIRDYNTFITLASTLQDAERIKENLRVFFQLQAQDGNIVDGFVPVEKAKSSTIGYQYIHSDLAPAYAGHKNTVETDQESSLVQAVYKYVTATGDVAFLDEEIGGVRINDRLSNSLSYLMNDRFDEKYGLIWGATTADWGDVQPEHSWGVYLDEQSHLAIDVYDNAMFLVAIDNLLSMDKSKVKQWKAIREKVAKNVMKFLWDADHQKFIPHLYLDKSPFPDSFNENEIFYHGGTAIAMEANLLSKEQIKVSLDKMIDNVQRSGAPSIGLTLYPTYPEGSFKNPAMTPYNYQNGGDWTWFGGRIIKQLALNGFYQEAYEQIKPMLNRVIENDGFYEFYTVDNKPSGSSSFRGSAGVLFDAITLLEHYAEIDKELEREARKAL